MQANEQSASVTTTDATALANLVGRIRKTRDLAAQARLENPDDPRAQFGAYRGYILTGAYQDAFAAIERACALEPENTHFLHERGVLLEYLGQADAAERNYQAAIAAEPLNYKARQALTQLRKQTPQVNSLDTLKSLFDGYDPDGWRTLHIGHAIAKTYEDFGDLDQSMAWLARAKARRRAIRPYAPATEERLADAIVNAPDLAVSQGYDSNEPIFVCGLPRSGTTLADRILSSHSEVMSAGEIANFAMAHKLMSGSTIAMDAKTLSAPPAFDLAVLGRAYIESTRPLTGSHAHFVDKAPGNYLLAERILLALPNARVICLRRHPLDSVLSNYKQIFPIDDLFYDYVYDLESAAHKVVQTERILQHWAEHLPPERFMVLNYEALVAHQEPVTRRLLEFCGLAWDQRCLDFHHNTSGVATPSASQVRMPMNAASVRRWEKFGALLDPARHVLERSGVNLS